MSFQSTLYVGSVMHRRLRPRAHRLRYRVFWILLDLDEIGELPRGLRLFSRNCFNLVSFHDADLGDGLRRDDRARGRKGRHERGARRAVVVGLRGSSATASIR